jgi:multidrug efflux pump subunit AcrA (membrane-fusion protein)
MVAGARLQPDGGARLARIPVGALVTGNGEHGIVFVLEGDRARRREVQVAFIDGDALALRAGIKPGEVVITDGAPYIDDGERVAVAAAARR